jgi:hypothetical protein
MQEIKQTDTNIVIKYKALDGTIFKDKEECAKYETTLACYLKTKYKSLVQKTITEGELTTFGSDDYYIDLVLPKSEEDVKNVMLYILYNHSYIQNPGYESKLKEFYSWCNTAYYNQETLLVGRGDSENICYPLGTLEGLIKHINTFKSEVHE